MYNVQLLISFYTYNNCKKDNQYKIQKCIFRHWKHVTDLNITITGIVTMREKKLHKLITQYL